ncbi:MAG: hypothetical protein BWY76_00121 [bacterium ADurb.Bin429]|nr:MAG: hypothetical protein BWY76_00121 [bacterium ADurb.Bin429]
MGIQQSAFTLKLMIVLGIGILVLAAGLFGWHRQNVVYASMDRKVKDMEREIRDIKSEVAKRDDLRDEQLDLAKKLQTIDGSLIDYEYMPSYLEQLQNAATRTGNAIVRIQPDELRPLDLQSSPLATAAKPTTEKVSGKRPTKAPARKVKTLDLETTKYRVQQINLEVEGSYLSLLRLLDTLRTFPKLVYVRTLDITPRRGRDIAPGAITARLDTYAIITPEQYKLADAPVKKAAPVTNGGAR